VEYFLINFDFIKYLDQGNENETGVPQDTSIGITTVYEITSFYD
jgi:hypothetical protein